MASMALALTTAKLILAFIMALLGSVALGGASAAYESKPGQGHRNGFTETGEAKETWEALDARGWWKIEAETYLGGPGRHLHQLTLNIGLNGLCLEAEQDFSSDGRKYDDIYYICTAWDDETRDTLSYYLEKHCGDWKRLEGWSQIGRKKQQALEALCVCRDGGTALKAVAIMTIVLLFTMSVLDILRIFMECCALDCVTCMAAWFRCVQLVLTAISFVFMLAAMALAALGCPVWDKEAAHGVMDIATDWAESDMRSDTDLAMGGGAIMVAAVFALHIVYAVLACMTPKMQASTRAPPVQGIPLQPVAQPPRFDPNTGAPLAPPKPTGAKFDPNTGAPIPKFDPTTGQQNWYDA